MLPLPYLQHSRRPDPPSASRIRASCRCRKAILQARVGKSDGEGVDVVEIDARGDAGVVD